MDTIDIVVIIGVLFTVIGVVYSHFNLKASLRKTDSLVNNVIINKAQGATYNGCIFNGVKSDSEIKDAYLEDSNKINI